MSDERRPAALPIDPRVDAAWRRASREEPPTSVDDSILAAARDAVRAAPPQRPSVARRPWWQSWQPLAAAAGVVGLALVLVPMLPREELPPPTSAAPAAPAARSADIALPDQTLQKAASNELADSARGAASAEAAASESVTQSAEVWAQQIADLHAAGDVASAAAELQAFRAAYPDADAHLPQDLRAWAATVPTPTSP